MLEPIPEMSKMMTAVERALDVSEGTRGRTAPNPPVGACVLDRNGAILAVAAHSGAGFAHAEALAIEQLRIQGDLDRAHQIVVTLEPCAHTGRTPPCAQAILESPIQKIVYATRDPNPRVAGGGAEVLRSQGRIVQTWSELGVDASAIERARDLIRPFVKASQTGLPWITLKIARRAGDRPLAESMIPEPGQKTFTQPGSLRQAHLLRRRADAIITGSGTQLADHPLWTVRRIPDHLSGPRRAWVVLDRRKRVSRSDLEEIRARRMDPFVVSTWDDAMGVLRERGACEALVEAGPSLTQFCLDQALWDERWEWVSPGSANDGRDDQVRITARADSW